MSSAKQNTITRVRAFANPTLRGIKDADISFYDNIPKTMHARVPEADIFMGSTCGF